MEQHYSPNHSYTRHEYWDLQARKDKGNYRTWGSSSQRQYTAQVQATRPKGTSEGSRFLDTAPEGRAGTVLLGSRLLATPQTISSLKSGSLDEQGGAQSG